MSESESTCVTAPAGEREREDRGDSERPIGLLGAVGTVIASMIGVGIFVSPGYTLDALQSPWLAFLAWAIGGVIAVCGAIAYGALAGRLCESGGEYLYLSRNVHPWAGFVAGWTSLFAGFAGPTAAAALAFEDYVFDQKQLYFSPFPAISLILLMAIFHCVQTRLATLTQAVFVLTKVLFLAIVGCGLVYFFVTRGVPAAVLKGLPDVRPSTARFDLNEFATSLMWIALSYTGFNAAIYVADEVKQPRTTVPASLRFGTVITVALYLALVGSCYFLASDPRFGSMVWGPSLLVSLSGFLTNWWLVVVDSVQWVITLCLVTSVSAMLLTGPRVIAKMATDGYLPQRFCTNAGRPPRVAIASQALIAVVIVLVTPLRDLLTHLGMTLSLCSAASIATLFLPGAPRSRSSVRVAGGVYVFCTVVFAGLACRENPWNAAGAAAVLVTATIAYAFRARFR